MIRFDSVVKRFDGREVLSGVSFTVAKGEVLALVGPSGTGKSVTLKHLVGLLSPTEGSVWLDDTEISAARGRKLEEIRARIGYLFQGGALLGWLTVGENVALPLFYQGVSRKKRNQLAMEYLEKVGLREWAHHLPNELSGGQKQRVAIARALITQPRIILADEPTGALDSKTSLEVMQLLKRLHEQGMTIVVVTHESGVAYQAEKIVHIKDGLIERVEVNDGTAHTPFGVDGVMK